MSDIFDRRRTPEWFAQMARMRADRDSRPRPSAAERFWPNVQKKAEGCWLWTAGRFNTGYGCFRCKTAHRVSWELTYGPIPTGLYVCHHCDNRLCVRPDHLFLGTHQDNMRDMKAKGRAHREYRQTHCKRGHEFTPENTGRWFGNSRTCKACKALHAKRWAKTSDYNEKRRAHRAARKAAGLR